MMKCPDCGGRLEVVRACRKVAMKCQECGREYRIHEVADQLDPETEEILGRWTAIIYD
jgi:uncharacterized protein (DUF983 family)